MKKSPDRDRLHLLHMRDAATQARQFISGRSREDFDNDLFFQFALAKAVELIGESANRISEELQLQHPQIPWRRIIGMRHVLVHNYWRVEKDVIWETVQTHIPTLITQLEQLLESTD
ncbi:MAG: DUF86 domain-containing protein [Chloroflexi bacterium]|nr:DUF86 domain-containing protein [Chloroflexota bacterium]